MVRISSILGVGNCAYYNYVSGMNRASGPRQQKYLSRDFLRLPATSSEHGARSEIIFLWLLAGGLVAELAAAAEQWVNISVAE